MLDELLGAIFEVIIEDLIWNLILKPIGLLLFYIFKFMFIGIFSFGKWSWEHIAAAAAFVAAPVIKLFKRKDYVDDDEVYNGYYESDYVNSSSDRNA